MRGATPLANPDDADQIVQSLLSAKAPTKSIWMAYPLVGMSAAYELTSIATRWTGPSNSKAA